MYRDGDRHTWRGFLGLIDDEIKAICRSRAVLLRVRAPFRLWIVGENKREHMHVHTRKYTVHLCEAGGGGFGERENLVRTLGVAATK